MHNADFSNTFSFQVMYKSIQGAEGNVPLQFTFVWGMNNLFNVKGLVFSGFFDIWGEKNAWAWDYMGNPTEVTGFVILSEPQLWYNIGQHFKCNNLYIGGELELACNFAGGWQYNPWVANKGFNVAPCAGVKWVF